MSRSDGAGMIGQSVRRKEDVRFLTGRGTYLPDVHLPGMKHIALLRSPYAHARIVGIDTSAAAAVPGVVAVFTGSDLAAVSRPASPMLPHPPFQRVEWYGLAVDKVRFAGEPVAAVVAETRYIAEDAAELIEVDYEPLPVVVDPELALREDAPLLYEEWGTNEFVGLSFATGEVEKAFAAADGVLVERFSHHRIVGFPLDGHGACGSYEPATGDLLLYASTQLPHQLRTLISDVTGLSEGKIRVIAPDMGGGFGLKQHFVREEQLVAVLAMQLPYPVSWVQDRSESLVGGVHAREQVHEVEVAYRNDGRILGLRARLVGDLGNPVLSFAGSGPVAVAAASMTGAYDIPNYAYQLHGVATNKSSTGGYRGFGQPQALFTMERALDMISEELDLDAAEIRRRNLIPDDPRPFVSPTGGHYDIGSMHEQFSKLLEAVRYEDVKVQQEAQRAEGRYVGIGLACFVELNAPNVHMLAGRFGGYETAMVTVAPDGHVTVRVGTKGQGQGHETVFAQVAADALTIPFEQISVRDGDTDSLPSGMGTWGSRSAVMGSGAVMKACGLIREKATAIAAHLLQATADEVALADGVFTAGEQSISFAEVAGAALLHPFMLPPGMEIGLAVVSTYDPGTTASFPDEDGKLNIGATHSSQSAAAVVEVDVNTGRIHVHDFVLAHDVGRPINPMLLEGQIIGSFAQGIGALLLEEFVYDEEGQPLTTTLLDYTIPGFGDVPPLREVHMDVPSESPGGFRGVGQIATIMAPAAIANAVADALGRSGVKISHSNLAPARLRDLMRQAGIPVQL